MDMTEIKKQLLDFTINSVESFLNEHPNLEFYSFAYDCHVSYAEINLCFNTEAEFDKTLKHYQTGKYSQHYQSDEEISHLKFNTGDWKYQCFETLYVLADDEIATISDKLIEEDFALWEEFVENLLDTFCEVLLDFSKTETFNKIPKTDNFLVFCIDRNEDFESAITRLEKVKNKYIAG